MLNSTALEAGLVAATKASDEGRHELSMSPQEFRRHVFSSGVSAYLTASMPEDVELRRLIDKCREMSDGGEYSWWSRLAEILASLSAKVEELTRDNGRLRKIVSQVCVALGNGAHTDADCTIEFMEFVPAEVGLVVGGLRASLAERDRIIAEKDKALEPFAREAGRRTFLTGSTVNDELLIGGSDLRNRDLLAARAALQRRAG